MTGDLPLVHVDAALAVFDKPAGVLAVPGRGADKQDCLWHRALQRYADLLVVHRIDMATSGLIAFARGAEAQRRLSMAFEARLVDKAYEAVVQGLLGDDEGEITLPVGVDWLQRPRQRIDTERGKPSLTRWRVLERDAELQRTRLALSPHTGRSHQLRVHLQAIGHPIVGDALYAPPAVATASPRLLLHATGLAFEHPQSGRRMAFASPAPF